MNNTQYLNEQKTNIIDNEKFKAYCKNYAEANSKNKDYASISRQATNIVDSCANGKVANKDIDTLKNICQYMLAKKEHIEIINNMNVLDLKKSLVEVYNKCQAVGVIKTQNGDTITREIDFKHGNGTSTLKKMFLIMFSTKHTEIKPPKKEKAKKTVKK